MEWKKTLTPNQYYIMVESGTEPPFQNEYHDNHQKGVYVSAATGEVLFSCTVAAALEGTGATAGAAVGSMPFLQLPQFELRGRRSPIDIWCVPALERLAL